MDFHPRFNFISGENGVGKTAFLEAISIVCTGQSFRVRDISPLIQFEQTQLSILSHLQDEQTIGIQKTQAGVTTVRINSKACGRSSELATLLPSQVIYQDVFEIIDAGPTVRRQLLDWGLFHVKHAYHEYWSQYKQALKQRNALLKQRAPKERLAPWDHTLSQLADEMHAARKAYLQTLAPVFQHMLGLLTNLSCDIQYDKGWEGDAQDSLRTCLAEHYALDYAKQYTTYGPHHADLLLVSPEGGVKKIFSRGQQKMVLLALKLAQAQLLGKPGIYLWDDICSEIDATHLQKLAQVMADLPGQYFISGIRIEESPLATLHAGKIIALS